MASPSDEELLACPKLVKTGFIHREKRDVIARQAGKYISHL